MTPIDPSSLLASLPRGAKILIVRLRSLGDMVLETPVIAALHAWRPDLRISVLVEPWCAAVLEGNPNVAEVILSRGTVATALQLRRRQFSMVFNQHGGPRSALMTGGSGAPLRVCWAGYQFSFLYNVHVPDKKEFFGTFQVHMVEHRISQFYWTGLPRGPIPRTRLFPQPDARASVARTLQSMGIAPGEAYAVLQPGARASSMCWPAERFAKLARWLRQAHGITSVVNLGRRDDEVAPDARRELKDCAKTVDSFDARQLFALIEGACLFAGNDSGPAHVAPAVDCPCVVLFGPTNPAEWRPRQGEHRVLQPEHGPAIASIGTGQVLQACEDLLAARPTRKET